MLTRKSVGTSFVVALALAAGIAISTLAQAEPSGAAAPKGSYKIDTVHSSVIFKIKHLNTANFYGRFNEATGSFSLDEGGSIDVKINVDSFSSGNPKRDQHLRGPDFFSVKEFPEATFKSSSIKKTGASMYEAAGEMTLHGVTKPVTAKVELTGTGKGMKGNPIAGIEARVIIHRSEFGIKGNAAALGEDVELIVALEGAQ